MDYYIMTENNIIVNTLVSYDDCDQISLIKMCNDKGIKWEYDTDVIELRKSLYNYDINPSKEKKYINIESEYSEIKKYYDQILNKDGNLVKTSNDEPTPISCVEEMVDKIPNSFWENPDIKILDPCCGSGNFPLVIYFKLIEHHSRSHILENMLYFNDTNLDRIGVIRHLFNYNELNIYNSDFLKMTDTIMFDLIVANPPYAHLLPNGKRASKNHNLIGQFLSKSFTLLKEGGFILYITPDNWMSISDRNTLIYQLTSLQIIHINIHTAKKYFKKIGSSFVWYLIENKPFYKKINIEGVWKKKEYTDSVKSCVRGYIPLCYTSIIQSILEKTIDNDNVTKYKIETSSYLHKYTKQQLISITEDDIYKYKLIHTPKQTVWSSIPHKFQDGYKVFLPTTSYYGPFVDSCGMTQSIAFIRCDSKEDAELKNKILNHTLYRFINNICRYGNFNNVRILQKFPVCNQYDNVYASFNITEDEVKYIEANI